MMTKSALAALGLKPDSMRSVWNGMTGRDRKFLAKLAMVFDEKTTNEHSQVRIVAAEKSWDSLSRGQQISLREASRRLSSWAHAVGICEAMKDAA